MEKAKIAPLVLKPDPLIETTRDWSKRRFHGESRGLQLIVSSVEKIPEVSRARFENDARMLRGITQRLTALAGEKQ
jgi:hypothetical protein